MMVYWVDNKTAVKVRPLKKPTASIVETWFSDQLGQTPTIPQADWFNMVQGELLGIATVLGVDPNKLDDNQLGVALKTVLDGLVPTEGAKVVDTFGDSKTEAGSQRTINVVKKKADQVPNPIANHILIAKDSSTYALKTIAELKALLNIDDIPVDQIFYFDGPIPPSGYITRSGQPIDKVKMPKIFARYGANMPDDRDRGHRMTGTLAGAVGTTQEDAIRNITGSSSTFIHGNTQPFEAIGAFIKNAHLKTPTGINGGGDTWGTTSISIDASRVVPTADENRVKSRIVLACNKIQ